MDETQKIAGAELSSYSPEDQAFFRFWYSHMKNDLMQPPLVDVRHSTARYIWDAAMLAAAPEALAQVSHPTLPAKVNRYCRAKMCLPSDEHEVDCPTYRKPIPPQWREAMKVAREAGHELVAAEKAYNEVRGGPWVYKNVPHAISSRLHLAWQAHHAALAQLDALVGGGMKQGDRYNWKGQPERLAYIGPKRYPGDPRLWHQFERIDQPGKVWCEVLESELPLLEATKEQP